MFKMKTPVVVRGRNGRYGNNNWYSYSSKVKRIVNMYSNLEYDHWILVEFDKRVVTFCEQPDHVQEFVNDEWIDTIPDMWISDEVGVLYVEVKPKNELDPNHANFSLRSREQIKKQQKWCEAKGFRHEVRSEDYIYRDKLCLKNLKTMLPYIDDRKVINEVDRKRIIAEFNNKGKLQISDIDLTLSDLPKYRIRDAVYNMIYEGKLQANLSQCEIGSRLEVWICEQEPLH
jgi:hypothetical protein